MITWEDWKEKDVPAYDKEYEGRERRTGLEEEGCDWEYYEEFLNDFAYELQEAKSQGLGLLDWQEWYSLEYFFGQRLSYEDYLNLKEYYDNDEDGVNGDILDLQCADPIIPAIRKGDTAFFTCSDDESEIKNAKVTILRLLTSEEADLFDIGPMYKVQMADGSVEEAFYDELSK